MTPPETTPNQPKETPVTVTRWTLKDTLAVVGVTLAEHAKHAAGRALDRVGINIDLWLENLQIGYLPSPLCILCDRFADDGDLCDRCKVLMRDALGITLESSKCQCLPCPGRGTDGHGMEHCAECCWGTYVEAEPDCPVHGMNPEPSATPAGGWPITVDPDSPGAETFLSPQRHRIAPITAQTFTQYSACGCYIPPGATKPVHRLACHLTPKETP